MLLSTEQRIIFMVVYEGNWSKFQRCLETRKINFDMVIDTRSYNSYYLAHWIGANHLPCANKWQTDESIIFLNSVVK